MLACRPMLPLALAVAAGALAGRFVPALSAHAPAGAALFAAAFAWFFLRREKDTPDSETENIPAAYLPHFLPSPGFVARRGVNAFLLVLCLGCFFLAAWRQGAWRDRLAAAVFPRDVWCDAVLVADAPNFPRGGRNWRVPARVLSVDGGVPGAAVPVLLYGSSEENFRRGDRLAARVRLSAPRPPLFPGAFNSALWLERDGLAAYANIARRGRGGGPSFRVLPDDNVSPVVRARRLVDGVRAAAVGKTLEYGGAHGPMLAAMLYGCRDGMDRGVTDAFRRVGIGHVLAISGLHVGLVVGLLWWLSGWLPFSSRGRSLACLAAAVVYLGLSGGQVAAARATLMAVIHLGARAAGRRGDMLNSLGAAAFFIILDNPSAPFDISFQLSFTAVVFIHIGMDASRRGDAGRPPPPEAALFRNRLRGQIDSLTRLSVATWIGLYPIVAAVFQQVNLVGLPINVVVIPLMGAVLAGGLLLPALGWIPGAAFVLAAPSRALVRIAFAADALPYSSFAVHPPPGLWTAVFYGFVFLYLVRRMIADGARRRRWLIFSAAGIAAGLAGVTLGMRSLPPPAAGRLAHIPGHGLGVFAVETPSGEIALIGQIRRQGLTEAGWLHHLRRNGPVSVVTVGRGRRDTLEGLAFHYPPVARENVPLTSKREAGAAPVWRAVAAAPGVEYALVRNARGRAVALAVRSGGGVLAATSRSGDGGVVVLEGGRRVNLP